MSDNRKYYYLKLKENYFGDDSIVLLESMQDGVLYPSQVPVINLCIVCKTGRLLCASGSGFVIPPCGGTDIL